MGQKSIESTEDTIGQKMKTHRLYGAMGRGVALQNKGKSKAKHYPTRTKTSILKGTLALRACVTAHMIDLDTAHYFALNCQTVCHSLAISTLWLG